MKSNLSNLFFYKLLLVCLGFCLFGQSWAVSPPPNDPVITSFSPTSAANGTTISIYGINLSNVTYVSIGSGPAAIFTIISSTEIRAIVNCYSWYSSGDIVLYGQGGYASLGGFQFLDKPRIASFKSSPNGSGYSVTISGSNFENINSLSFSNSNVTSFVVESLRQISVQLSNPPSGLVTVSNAVGTDTSTYVECDLKIDQITSNGAVPYYCWQNNAKIASSGTVGNWEDLGGGGSGVGEKYLSLFVYDRNNQLQPAYFSSSKDNFYWSSEHMKFIRNTNSNDTLYGVTNWLGLTSDPNNYTSGHYKVILNFPNSGTCADTAEFTISDSLSIPSFQTSLVKKASSYVCKDGKVAVHIAEGCGNVKRIRVMKSDYYYPDPLYPYYGNFGPYEFTTSSMAPGSPPTQMMEYRNQNQVTDTITGLPTGAYQIVYEDFEGSYFFQVDTVIVPFDTTNRRLNLRLVQNSEYPGCNSQIKVEIKAKKQKCEDVKIVFKKLPENADLSNPWGYYNYLFDGVTPSPSFVSQRLTRLYGGFGGGISCGTIEPWAFYTNYFPSIFSVDSIADTLSNIDMMNNQGWCSNPGFGPGRYIAYMYAVDQNGNPAYNYGFSNYIDTATLTIPVSNQPCNLSIETQVIPVLSSNGFPAVKVTGSGNSCITKYVGIEKEYMDNPPSGSLAWIWAPGPLLTNRGELAEQGLFRQPNETFIDTIYGFEPGNYRITQLTWDDQTGLLSACADTSYFFIDSTFCVSYIKDYNLNGNELSFASTCDTCSGVKATLKNLDSNAELVYQPNGPGNTFSILIPNPGNYKITIGLQSDSTCKDSRTFTLLPEQFRWAFRDADGDGYGNTLDSIYVSNMPAGYVDNRSDCDDSNASINSVFQFYVDADLDGKGGGNVQLVCAVNQFTPPAGFSLVTGDCNDNNAAINNFYPFYIDNDLDGFGAGILWSACALNATTPPPGYSLNNSDCNDNNADVHAFFTFYRDNDGDGYGSNQSMEACAIDANSPPSGSGLVTNNTDCDDGNPLLFRTFTFYIDSDRDGFGSTVQGEACAENANSAPSGFSLNNTDCDDTNPNKNQLFEFYVDADGDGYGSTTTALACAESAAYAPQGYSSNNTDCDDSNPLAHAKFQYYVDSDGDGFGTGSLVLACAENPAIAPAGYSKTNTDCNPNNASIYPGAVEICNAVDDNCDGVIDEGFITVAPPVFLPNQPLGCRGRSGIVFSINPLENAVSYQWTLPNGATGTSTTNSISLAFTSTFAGGNLCVRAIGTCGGSVTTCFSIVPTSSVPSTPANITGQTTGVCLDTLVYTASTVSSANSYSWTVPAQCTILSGQGTNSIRVVFTAPFSSASISVRANNCIGASGVRSLTITPNLTSPTAITGPVTGVCAGGSYSFTASAVLGAKSYNWTIPPGASIQNGSTTNTVSILFPVGFVSGTISAAATSTCFTGTARSLGVRSTPLSTGVITGPNSAVCAGSSKTFSVNPVVGATQFNWAGVPGISVSNQGSSSVSIQFPATFISGTLTVTPSNACGNGTASTLALSSISAVPGAITGPTTGICAGSSVSYSIASVANATSYNWTLPTGSVINSGQGTTNVNFTLPSGFTTGSVAVASVNACGQSGNRTITINSVPGTPGTISGTSSGTCGGNRYTYTIAAVTGASSYNWTFPNGTTINSGQGSTTVSATLPILFTSGTISVVAQNACGSGPVRSLAITSVVGTPGTIAGTTSNLCGGGLFTYSISPVTGATSYSWVPPAGCSISTNSGTAITMNIPPTFTTGTLSVSAVNACGPGAARTLALTRLPATPSVITGPTTVCPSATGLAYSVSNTSGLTYTWNPPTGGQILSGQGSSSASVKWGSVAGSLTVKANNTCGSSGNRTLAVSLLPCRQILSESDEASVNIYPNPGSGKFQLQFTGLEGMASIQVYNVQGQLIYESTENIAKESSSVHLEGQASGIYWFKIRSGAFQKSIKVVKE